MKTDTLPTIEHATVTLNQWGRVVIQMNSGWVFYDLREYPEGTPAEDICYYGYGVYPPDYDFNNIIVVDKSTIDADQIYDNGDKPDETI